MVRVGETFALLEPVRIEASFGLDFGETDLLALDEAAVEALKAAMVRHGLIVFRRQVLDNQDFETFVGRFGEIDTTAKGGRPPWAETATIYISNLRSRTGAPFGSLGMSDIDWHADNYHIGRPSLSFLYALEPAPSGGRTLFQRMDARYRRLDQATRDRIAGLRACYRSVKALDPEERMFTRPIVVEATDGTRYLDISERAVGIEGVSPEEEAALMRVLLSDLEREQDIYAHDWAVGDLLVYDNAQLLHRREAFQGLRLLKAMRVFTALRRQPADLIRPVKPCGVTD